MKATCTAIDPARHRQRAGASAFRALARDAVLASAKSSFRNTSEVGEVRREDRRSAFQPKCDSMKAVSQPQGRATISTGGAAKCVSVPPIETLTNSSPRVAYDKRRLGRSRRTAAQEQRTDRHGRGFRDQGPEQRAHREQREPPGRRRAASQRRDPAQGRFGEREDRARRGERHDHDDE